MRKFIVIMLCLVLLGVATPASAEAADKENTDKPVEKNLPLKTDKEIAEILEMLKMMEVLKDMEMLQDYHIFAEEASDEKEN